MVSNKILTIVKELESDKGLQGYEEQRVKYMLFLKDRHGSIRGSPPAEQARYASLYGYMRHLRTKLRQKALVKYRLDWAHKEEMTPKGLGGHTTLSNTVDFENYMDNSLYPVRKRIARGMYGFPVTDDTLDIRTIMALIELISCHSSCIACQTQNVGE